MDDSTRLSSQSYTPIQPYDSTINSDKKEPLKKEDQACGTLMQEASDHLKEASDAQKGGMQTSGHWGTTFKEMKESIKETAESVYKAVASFFSQGWETIKGGVLALRENINQGMEYTNRRLEGIGTAKGKGAVEGGAVEAEKELSPNDQKLLGDVLKMAETDPRGAGALLHETKSEDLDEVVKKVAEKMENSQQLAEVILGAVGSEVKAHSDAGNLLRSNSAGSKLLKAFTNKYLAPQFAKNEKFMSVMNGIPKESLSAGMDSENNFTISDEKRRATEQFISEFMEGTNGVLESNKEDPDMKAFQKICHEVSQQADEKFGNDRNNNPTGSITAGNFLFLRFLNPALINPNQFGMKAADRTGTQTSNAVAILKVVQNMANRIKFGQKEEYMTPFNTFLENEGIPELDKIRDRLIKG